MVYTYAAVVLVALFFLHVGGDRWWPGTYLLFGPRWIFIVPLPFLLIAAVLINRRMLVLLICCAVAVFVFLLDLRMSFLGESRNRKNVIRVLTCNVGYTSFDLARLLPVLQSSAADIVALQECPIGLKEKIPGNLHVVQKGELVIISRFPIREVASLNAMHPPHKWPRLGALHCVVSVPGRDISFVTVHLPSPRFGLQNMMDRNSVISIARRKLLDDETANRTNTARAVQALVATSGLPVIVAGDFNMPIESAIYKDVWSGYANAFSKVGRGYGWTEFNRFRSIPIAVRIDHILTGKTAVPLVCAVGPDIGSDHLPLIADIGY
ncbi:MAG: endonuclease/exonuclease/phosphatase family protein [Desulfuromonadaceae bacterium]|nr:endonuclease/exonuclease/phosphatase family protein [Desulfuromonadaceae bacterium]